MFKKKRRELIIRWIYLDEIKEVQQMIIKK